MVQFIGEKEKRKRGDYGVAFGFLLFAVGYGSKCIFPS